MQENTAVITVTHLKIEYLRNTLGIGFRRPGISWQTTGDVKDWRQEAYEIECQYGDARSAETTGRVETEQSVLVAWPFDALASRIQASLRVRVWGTDGTASDWSEPLNLEVGLLNAEDWEASFITPDWEEDPNESGPAPYLRRGFTLKSELKSARLYVTALGLYEVCLNGKKIGEDLLSPGWTVYDQHLVYQSYDVTDMLTPGENAVGAILAEGWFKGRLGFGGGRRNFWGEKLALLMQLELHYADGTAERIVTDSSWEANTGPILTSSIYDGERYDARKELSGWCSPEFDDSSWKDVRTIDWDMDTLEAPQGPPIRRIERLKPVSISTSPSGKTLVDFGQNLVGRLAITVQGPAGHTVTLRHAEVLEHGELGARPLRFAEATDSYILKGEGEECWEPRFTFHGFRYVEVENWPGELKPEALTAVVIHSDLERIGWFECSQPLLNKLHENVVWSMKGNFLGIPTDCPQRDERLGWTGDIEVFTPTALFLHDAGGFLSSWLKDLAIDQQKSDGAVPHVVPNILGKSASGAAAWGDAAVIVPWTLYQRYGDSTILAEQFESMCAWVDFISSRSDDNGLWTRGFQFGDWLDPTAPPDRPAQAKTNKEIVATAYYAYSARIVAWTAELLGLEVEAKQYSELAGRIASAFQREYLTPSGRMMCDAETAYSLALVFDLISTQEQRTHAGERLAELVRDGGYHIRTGFVGTPLICDALCGTGHHRDAYRLLLQQECPSWLYPVTMGATTIWERWDSMLPDGSINPGEMTSFNHYALGAVADWMHRTIGGIAPASPGYREMRIAPRPGGGITQCTTRHLSPYGPVECRWQIVENRFEMTLSIPPNTTAEVLLPGGDNEPVAVGSGEWNWSILYKDPDVRGPYTVDDLIGEILSDRSAKSTLLELLERLNAPEFLRMIILHEGNIPLREALKRLPNYEEAVETIDDALARK